MNMLLKIVLLILAVIGAQASASINCSPTRPFTTTVPSNASTFNNIAGALNSGRFNLSFWRINCSNEKVQILMTVRAISGQPLISPLSFSVRQGSVSSNVVLWGESIGLVSAVNIEPVSGAKTYLLDPLSSQIDERQSFSVIYNEVSPNLSFSVPAAGGTSTGGGSSGPIVLKGALSGAWHNPTRSGEGVMVDISTVGTRNVIFIAMFTYNAGAQRWLVGSVDFEPTARAVTIPLIDTSGGNFNSTNNVNTVRRNPAGNAVIFFGGDCASMNLVYQPSGATTGSAMNFTRLLGSLKGVSCN